MSQSRRVLAFIAVWIIVALAPTGRAQSTRQTPPAPVKEVCYPYAPQLLKVEITPDVPGRGVWWRLTDGRQWNAEFPSEQVANNVLALARRYRVRCEIGPSHEGLGPLPVTYWKEPTGQTTTISPENCNAYDPAHLEMIDKGGRQWVVTDGRTLTLGFDNQEGASLGLRVARQYTVHCSVGMFVDYWK